MAILKDSFSVISNRPFSLSVAYWCGQTFQPTSPYSLVQVDFAMYRGLNASGDLNVSIRLVDPTTSVPTGSDLATGVISVDSITVSTAGDWYSISLSNSVAVNTSNKYAIIAKGDAIVSVVNFLGDTASGYADGALVDSTDQGSSWTFYSTFDLAFKTYGTVGSPVDKTYSKHLVAIGGNQVWWEPTAGTLAEITAARNDIDTTQPLSAFSGYQKAFVVNGANLKILDLANIKLATSEIGVAGVSAPQRSITLTGSVSSAKILTDFCTAATGSAEVYGYLIEGTAFVSDDVVTGGPSNTVSFTLITASITAPHWYDWTPQHNDTANYGSMPSKARYGCIYRGRAVLAGHPDYPHQWYMSDVADVFRWDYRSNNPLSAIRGGNADAGQIGDIIKALIPLGDDYLIFGCANSIWQLSGDPAAGGSLNPVTEDTGIFGPKAWCLDDQKNLYFFGRNGLYKASIVNGMSIPVNISQLNLPNWIDDWALDDSTHRIVLSFDPVRRGIIISKTNLADGINENYWFDLKTNGFFKEEYPPQNGIFCSHFYNSTEPDYRGLLLGCKDGYIRYFNDSAKDDDVGTSSAVITSYVLLPVLQAGDLDKEGKLNSLTVELAGGASSGVFGDTDCLDMFIYAADDAETLLEDVKDGVSAIVSVHLTGTGRKSKLRYKISGHCIGIKLQNSTSNSTWAINRIYGNIIEGGNIKG